MTTKKARKPALEACHFPTAIGEMAISWRGSEVTGIFLPEASRSKLLASVRRKSRSPRLGWTEAPPVFVGHLAAQIRQHLRGDAQEFSLKHLSMESKSPFSRKVYECSTRIPSGSVLTYRELALEAGKPKAFRAVGQAMARNPFPIVIPCHRVVGSGGKPGGFSAHGGLATKARILEIETGAQNSS